MKNVHKKNAHGDWYNAEETNETTTIKKQKKLNTY